MKMSETIEDRDINNTCRVCLDTIFSDSVALQPGNDWLEQYEYCFGLTVGENDEPKKMCQKCAEFMKEFVNFKKKCHHSHQYWKTIGEKCYTEDCKVKEEIDDSLLKAEIIKEENVSGIFHDFVQNLNQIDDQFEDNISYQYDDGLEEEPEYGIGQSKIKKTKQKITSGRRKYVRKAENNKKVLEVKSSSHPCGLCDFTSTESDTTMHHLKEHSIANDLACKICKYEGYDFGDMISHRYEHIPKQKRLLCCGCGKRFYYIKRLQFHFRAEHLGGAGGWCAPCRARFARYKTWRQHERLLHEGGGKYVCDHCGRAYLYRNQIVQHLADVAGVKKYVCDTCGGAFKRITHLRLHMRTVHKNDAVKCDHCGITYKNKHRLQHHLKMAARTKEFVCKICSKAFLHAVTLKEHEFWHTGERPFPCEICGKSYKKKNELKIHIERHRGIRKFKCTVCSKDFVTNSQLKVHSAVHTGVRRYKCTHCERSFHQRKFLIAHCLSKHNIEHVIDKK